MNNNDSSWQSVPRQTHQGRTNNHNSSLQGGNAAGNEETDPFTLFHDIQPAHPSTVDENTALKGAGGGVAVGPPPPPLATGWIMKESRSNPGAYYYYNQDTGESTWEAPPYQVQLEAQEILSKVMDSNKEPTKKSDDNGRTPSTSTAAPPSETSVGKRRKDASTKDGPDPKPSKRQRKVPKEVRVLHILKKHKDSKRPASWRSNNKPITITPEEAREELEGLLEILREEEGNPDNLIATFQELASQESDCNSAKRKGDLGFFGRKKMRPEFEEAAFGLDINELSGVVNTASGAHILLRLE